MKLLNPVLEHPQNKKKESLRETIQYFAVRSNLIHAFTKHF